MGLSNDHLVEISQWLEGKLSLLNPKYLAPPDTEAMELPYMKKGERARVRLERKKRLDQARRKLLDPKLSENIGDCSMPEDVPSEDADQEKGESLEERPTFEGLGRGLLQNVARSNEELKASLQEKLAAMKGARGGESSGKTKSKDKKRKKSEGGDKGSKSGYTSGNKNKKRKGEPEPEPAEEGGAAKVRLQFGSLEVDDAELGVKKKGPHKKKLTKQELLEEAEAKVESRKKFKKTGSGGDEVMSNAWNAAMGRAKGERVLDNPKLLRKAIKKEHKDKVRSAKKWKERNKEVAVKMKKKEDRAKANLKARSDKKMERRKMKRLKRMMS